MQRELIRGHRDTEIHLPPKSVFYGFLVHVTFFHSQFLGNGISDIVGQPGYSSGQDGKLWADSDRLLGVFKVLLKCGAWLGVSFA